MLLKNQLKVQNTNVVSCKTVYVQHKGKYTREQEESGQKERIEEKRRLIAGIIRSHENNL